MIERAEVGPVWGENRRPVHRSSTIDSHRPKAVNRVNERNMKFKQYDAVRVKSILVPIESLNDELNRKSPKVGDVAYIIEIYENPPGYELECSDADGITQWLKVFRPHDVEFEFVS